MAHPLAAASVLTLAAVVHARATLVVGPGFFPDVNAALAAASPGDTIRVLPGTYPTFQMQKGVTIRADQPGTVAFSGLFPCLVAVPTGQRGHLLGLGFTLVAVSGGHTSFDDCTIVGTAMAVTNGAVVVMQGCTVQSLPQLLSGNSAIRATQSELSLIDCTILGSGPGPLGGSLQPAIALIGSRLRGSNLQVQAGAGGSFAGAPAIAGDAASSLWLSDSTVGADPNVCPLAVAHGRHDRSTLTPNCSSTPSGFVLGVHRVQPVQPGQLFAVEFLAQPGMAVGLFAAYSFASQGFAELEQSLLLPASSWFALGPYVADAQGIAAAAWPIPAGPAITGQTVWVQGFSGFAFPLQASPLVGGVAR